MAEYKFIYKIEWYESKRHTKSHTSMCYLNAKETEWVYEYDWGKEKVEVRYVRVLENSQDYQMAVSSSNITKTVKFKNPIPTNEVLEYYPNLPEGLHWITIASSGETIGLYFKKGDEEKLQDEIHNVLWFFGEFEDCPEGCCCQADKLQVKEDELKKNDL
jgi:hypothetical protein